MAASAGPAAILRDAAKRPLLRMRDGCWLALKPLELLTDFPKCQLSFVRCKNICCVLGRSDYLKLQIVGNAALPGFGVANDALGAACCRANPVSGDRHDRAQSLAFFARAACRDQPAPEPRPRAVDRRG